MLPDKLASTIAAVEEMRAATRSTPRLAARVRGKVLHYGMAVPFIAVAAASISQLMHKRVAGLGPLEDVPQMRNEPSLQFVTSPDFSLELTGFFQGKRLIRFLVLKMKDFRNFVLDNCILDFDAEQVYLKLQATNLKNKEVTVNPKPQILEKNWFFENPIP